MCDVSLGTVFLKRIVAHGFSVVGTTYIWQEPIVHRDVTSGTRVSLLLETKNIIENMKFILIC